MKVIIFILLSLAVFQAQDSCMISQASKKDCGEYGTKQPDCEAKGCCWVPSGPSNPREIAARFLSQKSENDDDVPWCFYPGTDYVCQQYNFKGTDAGFTSDWYEGMYDLFMQNINVDDNGAVVAAPDTDTPGGSYFYHWMRDAALTMRTFMELNDYKYDDIKYNMEKYLQWVTVVQHKEDPNDISVLIEPKFEIPTRDPYAGPWCRPQTDGPGIRSGTLIKYANVLLSEGQDVSDQLWDAISTDLAWIVTGWESDGCDLWEEVRSTNFFWNRMAFYQALIWGSDLAEKLGKSEEASTYTSTAQIIRPSLKSHWNGNFIFESTNRELDSAVVHALVELNEDVFDISGSETAATIKALNDLFCNEYLINQKDDSAGEPGILYGRYGGDSYAGGNPWQLLTAALAEAFYQGASEALNKNGYLSKRQADLWRDVLDLSEEPTFAEFAAASKSAGDAVMHRIWIHVKDNSEYILTEQIDRNTGEQISAEKLTWSFANVLKTLHQYSHNETFQAKFK